MTTPSIVQHLTSFTSFGNKATPIKMPKPLTKGNYVMVFLEPGQPFDDLPADPAWPPAKTFAGLPQLTTNGLGGARYSIVPVYGAVVQETSLPSLPAEPWSGPNPDNQGTIFTAVEIAGMTAVRFQDVFVTQDPAGEVTTLVSPGVPTDQTLTLVLGGYQNGYGSPVTKVSPAPWKIVDPGGAALSAPDDVTSQWWLIAAGGRALSQPATIDTPGGATFITPDGSPVSISCWLT